MLTIGTGIGGCIILDGKIFHGFSNSACEVGYMHLDGGEFQDLGAASILTKKVAKENRSQNQTGMDIIFLSRQNRETKPVFRRLMKWRMYWEREFQIFVMY